MVSGNEKDYARILLISSIIGVLFITITIKHYGIIAIPLSLIIYESLSIIMITNFIRRTR